MLRSSPAHSRSFSSSLQTDCVPRAAGLGAGGLLGRALLGRAFLGRALLASALLACGSDSDPANVDAGGDAFQASAGVQRSALDAAAPTTELAAGLNNAGFEIWRTQLEVDNFVFSPASIGHALLMARAAADETTGAAIDQGFALPGGMSAHQAWNTIDLQLAAAANDEQDLTLALADRIWPRLGVAPDQGWVDLLASEHGVSSVPLDFAGDSSGSRKVINNWVSEQTLGLIPDLLPEGFIDGSTLLVLTDALYLAARWQTVFGKYGTEMDTFTDLEDRTFNVEYMRELEISAARGQGVGYVGCEIPYVGRELSMLLIIPELGQFSKVRATLGQGFLDTVDAEFTEGSFELLLPQWNTTSQLDLMTWLTDMGAAPGAYPLITPGAFLGGAVHGADIAVDDWGTVAAAATALSFNESGAQQPELTVHANRPYFYFIRHRDSGLVLFAGQVTNPTL